MKKMICLLVLVTVLASLFTGCIGSFECDLCGEDKFGVKNEESFFGSTITYCNDCKEDLEDLEEGIGSLFG